jgi:uncharacterized membrane protein YqjE
MPQPSTEDRRRAADSGFFGQMTGYASALASYLSARLRLAGLEVKEAAIHYVIIIALLIAALVVIVFGYFFVWMTIIFGISLWIISAGGPSWVPVAVTFGVALLHFGLAAGLAFYAKGKLAVPMFTSTLEEFNKDQQWLATTTARRN